MSKYETDMEKLKGKILVLTTPRLDEENMKSQYIAQRDSSTFFNYNPTNSS